jgi:hypothetical protein
MLRAKQNFRIWRSGTEPRPLPATTPDHEIERSNLTKEIEELQTQLEEAGVRYAKERSQLELQLTQEQQENRRLKDQVSKFRDIIVNKGSNADDVVSDAVIIQRFCELRQNIQKIVLKWYDVDMKPVVSYKIEKDYRRRQQQFFELWNKRLSSANLQNRSRGMIFELLNEEILGRPCFGLDRVKNEGAGTEGDYEQWLAGFEDLMTKALRGMYI